MLDQKIVELARNLILPEIVERHEQFLREMGSLVAKSASGGWHNSGRFWAAVCLLGEAEIKIRTRIAAAQFMRVVAETRFAFYPDLCRDLQHEVFIHSQEARQLISSTTARHLKHMEPQFTKSLEEKLLHAETAANRQVGGEIELFSYKASQPQSSNQGTGGTLVNVTGPVGVIQTGDGVTALVTQNLGREERETVSRALSAVREFIDTHKDGNENLAEIVAESETEIVKDRPNVIKVTSLLSGIATSIQTVAAAQPAYQTVLAALRLLGF